MEQKVSPTFLMDKQTNLIQRMGPVKHELYFPQCYGPAFNQQFVAGAAVVTSNPSATVNGNTAVPPTSSVPPTTAVNGPTNPNSQQTHTTATVTAVPASVAAVITAPTPQAIVAQWHPMGDQGVPGSIPIPPPTGPPGPPALIAIHHWTDGTDRNPTQLTK